MTVGEQIPYIGCAGWSLAQPHAAAFPATGSHLERYAAVFPAVEINSSFYRPHQRKTYERWARGVPAHFRFAVKVPKAITHDARLVDCEDAIDRFLGECAGLGEKLGPLLVQLPPGLHYHPETAQGFFIALRARYTGDIVCEPRHATWSTPEANALLAAHRIARVAADPARVLLAASPGGWPGLEYYRLHGSPRIYYSSYTPEYLAALAARLRESMTRGARVWCIFDNTAAFAATANALELMRLMHCEQTGA